MRILAFAVAVAMISGCAADTPAGPGLPATTVGIPPAWQGTIGPSELYEIGLDRVQRRSGRSAVYMTGPPLATLEVAAVAQMLRADNYRGQRVRLSAWVKGHDLIGPIAGIWMSVFEANLVTGYDNMASRSETGTTDWHEVSVVLDVSSTALVIGIGALRRGGGTLFLDDVRLEPVGTDVPSTNMLSSPNPADSANIARIYLKAAASPTNLGFEKVP